MLEIKFPFTIERGSKPGVSVFFSWLLLLVQSASASQALMTVQFSCKRMTIKMICRRPSFLSSLVAQLKQDNFPFRTDVPNGFAGDSILTCVRLLKCVRYEVSPLFFVFFSFLFYFCFSRSFLFCCSDFFLLFSLDNINAGIMVLSCMCVHYLSH